MEIIAAGLEVIGQAIAAVAWSTAFIYIIGIGTKTWLIYTGKAKTEELKGWFDFGLRRKKTGI